MELVGLREKNAKDRDSWRRMILCAERKKKDVEFNSKKAVFIQLLFGNNKST